MVPWDRSPPCAADCVLPAAGWRRSLLAAETSFADVVDPVEVGGRPIALPQLVLRDAPSRSRRALSEVGDE